MEKALVAAAVASAVAALISLGTSFWSAKSSHDAAAAAERALEAARLQWTSQIALRWHDYAHDVEGVQTVVIDFYNEGASSAFGLRASTSIAPGLSANPVEFRNLPLDPGAHVSRAVRAAHLKPPFLGEPSVNEPLYKVDIAYRDLRGQHHATFIFSFEHYAFELLRAFEDGRRHIQDPEPILRKRTSLPSEFIADIQGIDDIE